MFGGICWLRARPARLKHACAGTMETIGGSCSARFVTSTLCGQTVNTAVFYIFGLWGMIPTRVLTKSIVVASLTKISVELLLLPVTLKVSLWLKRIENVDYFDKATNFNPLKF